MISFNKNLYFLFLLTVTVSLTIVPSISLSSLSKTTTTTQLASAQSTGAAPPIAATATNNNTSGLQDPGQPNLELLSSLITTLKIPTNQLDIKMAQLSTSNKSQDIATLAYIWGFPLVTMKRQFNFVSSPNVPPAPGRGPVNTLNCAHEACECQFYRYCHSKF